MTIPPLIVGDGAYPLYLWLMTPYDDNLRPEQVVYNCTRNCARCVMERAFGCLKAHWRCLLLQLPVMKENLNSVICACITLHNICKLRRHQMDILNVARHHVVVPENEEPPADLDQRQQQVGCCVGQAITN